MRDGAGRFGVLFVFGNVGALPACVGNGHRYGDPDPHARRCAGAPCHSHAPARGHGAAPSHGHTHSGAGAFHDGYRLGLYLAGAGGGTAAPCGGDWRVHDGVDIAADLGTQVRAPAGGTVSDFYTDDLMGTTVVILHADGVMSTCSNLAAPVAVEIGDTVLTGDIIGTVGRTAIAESEEASHIHLSMTKDGVSVDPLEYLPQN